MSSTSNDHQICDIYDGSDFLVSSGVNAGEPITNASDSEVGDVYVFSSTSTAYDLIVDDNGNGAGNSSDHFEDNVSGQSVGAGSEIGALGDGLELESRLTFMGSDGSTVEVLIINNTDEGADDWSGEYFLPLSPLTPDMDYTLIDADIDPGDFDYSDYTCVCFSRGTAIRMADGQEKLIEDLVEGDMVLTRDNGAQPVRWIGGRTARAFGHLAPIIISKGALGNHSDLIVSQQHRMLISDWRAEVMLGSLEVLVKARDLVNSDTIYRREGGVVEYFHILFDSHEVIYSEGIPSESLHINSTTLDALAKESRAEIIELFPEIVSEHQVSAVASRMSLKSYEASALLKQVGFR
ncbi:MAG: Hint domain-containing protein [Alphaproteobacteria bacterium]|nr:Hint domain-containing protein [Alphaproteobacteria bacterium]